MLRITGTSEDEKTVTLRLDGRVVGTWVSYLEKLCLHHKNEENKTVVLDFSGVTFIDNKGLRMLEKIKDERIKIANYSLFVGALLRNLITSNKG